MRDIDVRIAVRERLREEHLGDADTRIVEEMGVWHGSVRVDIAVINGEIAAYELKSARDTLQRLPGQACLYNEVFDRVSLSFGQSARPRMSSMQVSATSSLPGQSSSSSSQPHWPSTLHST